MSPYVEYEIGERAWCFLSERYGQRPGAWFLATVLKRQPGMDWEQYQVRLDKVCVNQPSLNLFTECWVEEPDMRRLTLLEQVADEANRAEVK